MSRMKKLMDSYKKNPMKAFQKQERRQLTRGGRLAQIRPAAAEEAKRDKRTKEIAKKQVEKATTKTKPKATTKTKPKTTTKTRTRTKTKTTKPTTTYTSKVDSLSKGLKKQLADLEKKYESTTGQLSTIKSQRREAARARRQAETRAEKQFNRMRSQYTDQLTGVQGRLTTAQGRYNQLSDDMLAQRSDFEGQLISQRDEFAQALADQEEAYRLAQQEYEEQQRLAMEARRVGERTSIANQMRAASADPRFQIGMQRPETYGTAQFKRRMDFRPTVFQGIQASQEQPVGGIYI